MFVSDILSQKGGSVFTVSPETSVAQVSQQLSVRRIGSVLVLDGEGGVAGIVSERDLVRALASHGAKALELEARQVMTRDVVTCDPDESIDNVMEIMTRGRFRHLPVVRRGELPAQDGALHRPQVLLRPPPRTPPHAANELPPSPHETHTHSTHAPDRRSG